MNSLFEIELNKSDNLLKIFEEIHDYIYSNDGLSPQQTLEEFVKLLFIKIFDENNLLNQFIINSDEWNILQTSRKEVIQLKERIFNLFEETKKNYSDVFEPDDRIRLSQSSLGFAVNKLQKVSLINSSQDAKGLAFQKFLSHQEKIGQGQFFTPEPVIEFCVEILQPKPNESVIDPACGSGGFLISAIKYINKYYTETKTEEFITRNVYGFDINKSIARIAKMKLLLEANVNTNIFCINSLENLDELLLSTGKEDGFDILLTNPPFGAKINNKSILKKFDLGYKWILNQNKYIKTNNLFANQNAEILFIERCLQLLKEGGRMAIVLPNGNLENPSLEYLRYFIKLKSKILAIINLPSETFIPYGTGVKTSILFLEKDSFNKTTEYPIFFGRVNKIGYQGNKNGTIIYKKNDFGKIVLNNNQPIIDEDFTEIVNNYKLFQQSIKICSKNAFSIDFNELNGRFDYDFYSPENRSLFVNFSKLNSIKLGEICDIIKVKSQKLKNKNEIVEYIELSDINTNSFEIINSTTLQVFELPSRASYELKEGDIITAIAGNSVGTKKHATAFVTNEFDGAICTNGFRVLRNFKLDFYYFLYFLKSESFLKQMFMYRTGAAIPNVSDIDLANILIYLPNEDIQKEISEKVKKSFLLRQQAKKELEFLDKLDII